MLSKLLQKLLKKIVINYRNVKMSRIHEILTLSIKTFYRLIWIRKSIL